MGKVIGKVDKFDENIERLLLGKRYTPEEINEKIKRINELYPNVKIKRVCSYGRVSTTHDEQESSLFTQNLVFHSVCDSKEKDGWVLVEEVYDRRSATILSTRKKFLYIIEKAKQGYYDVLLFKDSKRFSRNTEDFLHLIEELKDKYGVEVYFINEGVSSMTATRDQLTIYGMMSESHSNGLHISVTNAMMINKKRPEGRMTTHTFGYDKPTVRDSRVSEINETEAELIRELFDRLEQKEGFSSICDDWVARGISTKQGNKMNTLALRRFARNKKYIGILEMNKDGRANVRSKREKKDQSEWIIAYRPDLRIISDEQFYKVQDILDNRITPEQRKKCVNPVIENRMLSGVIKCSCCGSSLIRNSGGNSKRPYRYFSCLVNKQRKRYATRVVCENSKSIREDELLETLKLYFVEILKNKEGIEDLIQERIKVLIKELKTADKQSNALAVEMKTLKDKLKRATELYIEGMVDKSYINNIKEELERVEREYRANNIDILTSYDVKQVCSKMYNSLEEFVSNGLNEYTINGYKFNRLFESIVADDGGKLVINFMINNSYLPITNSSGRYTSNYSGRIVNINNLIDWENIYKEVNDYRNLTPERRSTYRFSRRFKELGRDLIDEVNLII